MPIDRETFILVTAIGGPLTAVPYVLDKAANYLGPRITLKEFLPNISKGPLFLPRFTARPELMRGLWEEIRISGGQNEGVSE